MTKTVKSMLAVAGLGMAVLLLVFVFSTPAQAISSSDRHDMLAGKITEQQSALGESLAVLKSKPQEEWAQVEIQTYLANAMWTVQCGILQYKYDHERLPEPVSSLTGSEYIPVWPENPFNGFAPMEVLNGYAGFKPGELVMLVCPPEEYSGIKDPRPLSYELGVYGPDEEFAQYGNAEVTCNSDWAIAPVGVLYMTGARTESGKHLLEKWEKGKREAEEQNAATAESEDN
jgi:hypothetical protein